MMTKRPALASLAAVALLTACAKPAPAPAVEDNVEDIAAAVAPPPAPAPSMGPADYPLQLLSLIDPSPQCESYRAELEAAARVPSSDSRPVDINEVNQIVARASAAGCGRKKP